MRSTWNAGRGPRGPQPTATVAIVGLLVVSFLGAWLMSNQASNPFFKLLPYSPESKPWTLLTYPFGPALTSVLWFALACFILYQFLSSLERTLGTMGTAAFFVVMTLLGGIGYYVGTLIFGPSLIVPSLNLPMEVIVFTWCLRNPAAQIMLMFVIPVPTRVLMWLCVAGLVIESGWGNPPIGLFAALPILVAWHYATNRIPGLTFGNLPSVSDAKAKKKDDREFQRFREDVRSREIERSEKERLRKLFESSLDDDDEKKG